MIVPSDSQKMKMDTLISKLICIYAVILTGMKATAALRILVTKQSCGKTVDLAQEGDLYLDYEGASLGGVWETCEIKIKNSSPYEIICIKSGNSTSGDVDCLMALKYFVEFERYNYLSCSHFNHQPRCDRATETRAVFMSYLLRGNSVRVNLHVYIGKPTPPTTKRYTTDYWSSWSSWSYEGDYNKSSSRLGTGTVAGVVIGIIISLVAICLICIICCNAKAKKPDPRYSTASVQYQAAAPEYNYTQQSHGESGISLLRQGNQNNQQNTSCHSTQPLINTPAISNQYPGYQVDPPAYETASPYNADKGTQQISNIIPSAPPLDNIPDFPPPAYPGY